MRVSVVIPSFRGAWRVERLLESVLVHDPLAFDNADWFVVEDPSDIHATQAYERVLRNFPWVRYQRLLNWSNMHGAAKHAFEIAAKSFDPTWIFYLGDDVLVTPKAVSSVLHFLNRNELASIGLVQIPYWNAHDLTVGGYDGRGNRDWHPHGPHSERRQDRSHLLTVKEDMYTRDVEWLTEVPQNPHWNGEGHARPYVNVNGVGFACRRDHFFHVGGFAEGTWCLDESLSVRTWTRSRRGIVCLPGPCFVHYFGGATESNPPQHDLHTHERWTMAMGMTKEEASKVSYAAMEERTPAILSETVPASYFPRV